MQIFILDPDTANKIIEAGFEVKPFKDINGTSLWEFSYDGDGLDIGALVKENKIIVNTSPKTIYL